MSELVLYIPAAHTPRLYPFVARAAKGLAKPVRERTVPRIRLSDLRCLDVRMHGSLERVRMPLVYPFIRTDAPNFDQAMPGPHLLTGPDWLVLGRNGYDLQRQLSAALEARARRGEETTLRVVPFAHMEGPLPQEPNEHDTAFVFRKGSENHNQPGWEQNKDRLLELPEEAWNEVGISNTADLVHVFDEALSRLAPESPRLILDVGCGLGQVTRSLALRYPGAEVVGIDASEEACAVAAKAFPLPNLSFKAVDFANPLPFSPGQADIIVSTNAVPYAADQLGFARELFTLLAPGGLLLNHCRAEESQHFWDFPKSLGLPTNVQIFLCDWFAAAQEAGLKTEVASVPVGMAAHFFAPSGSKAFATPLMDYADSRRHEPSLSYDPWFSHVLLAHSARARQAETAALPLEQNHLARLSRLLNSVLRAPAKMKEAAIVAWICTARELTLVPEVVEFFEAVLPESATVLRMVLGTTLGAV
ncbi:MAG: class I SAM-dependent methyltransferase [Desulfovibrio sp.]|jgi:SAM-dependent methyltransferase|nr:class I SAM-dependent methyltransferase [Desulfovibrio sp.]